MEIERRFIVDVEVAREQSKRTHKVINIEQNYVAYTERMCQRIRKSLYKTYESHIPMPKFEFTTKANTSMALWRDEHNIPITENTFKHLSSMIEHMPLIKTRYMVYHNPTVVLSLDFYREPELEKEAIIEIEFASYNDAITFKPLPWFGKEVTNDKYYNALYIWMRHNNIREGYIK